MPVLRRVERASTDPHDGVDEVGELAFAGKVARLRDVANDPKRSVFDDLAQALDVVDIA